MRGITLTDLPAFAVHTITSGTEAEAGAHLQARGRSCLTAVSSGGAPSASGSSVLFTSRILLKHIAQLHHSSHPPRVSPRHGVRHETGHPGDDGVAYVRGGHAPGAHPRSKLTYLFCTWLNTTAANDNSLYSLAPLHREGRCFGKTGIAGSEGHRGIFPWLDRGNRESG